MELFLERVFDGLNSGVTYAALAMALVLIFKATTLVNFAQGELALLGAYLVLVLSVEQGLPVFLAIILAMMITAVLGASIERVLIRPFPPAAHLPLVIVTLGLFLMINALVTIVWKSGVRSVPSMFPDGNAYTNGVATLSWRTVGNVGTVFATFVLLTLLLNKTKIGLAFRAVSSNLESSELVGVDVGRTLQFGWALAAAVGTLAAALAVPDLLLEPTVMLRTLIYAFAAAALGGLDSLKGAIVGGLFIGIIRSVVVTALDDYIPSEFGLAVAVVVIMIVLLFRPAGLFGTVEVKRV